MKTPRSILVVPDCALLLILKLADEGFEIVVLYVKFIPFFPSCTPATQQFLPKLAGHNP